MTDMNVTDIPYMMLGMAATLREAAQDMMEDMVEKGKGLVPSAKDKMKKKKEATEKATLGLKQKSLQKTDELTEVVGDTVEKVLGQMGLITKSDINDLDKKLSSLERKLNKKAKEAEKDKKAEKAKTPAKK
jgi:polyhydroxyalkanoate synthesis regulator phasin